MRQIALLALALLLAAGPAAAQLTPAQKAEIEAEIANHGPDTDAAMYARDQQVPLAEAKRRLAIQLRDAVGPRTEPGPPPPPPPDSIGVIQRQVAEKEADTFAGLWIQHQPTYGVAVAFTRDAAATLRKYTTDPLFIPVERPGPTVAELHETQERMFTELQRLGAHPMMGGSDIKTGRITIEVVGDLTRFRQAVKRGEVRVPPYVEINEPGALPHAAPPPPPPGFVNPVKAFPRSRYRASGIELAVLITGKAVLGADGCLRLERERHSPVIVWANEAALDLSHGDVRIFNRATGQTVRPGETIILGGNSTALKDDADVIDENPACPGPYVLVPSPRPYAPFEAEMLARQAEELARNAQISLAEATRRLTEQRDREATLRAFGERLLREHPDAYAGIQTHEGKANLLVAEGAPVPPIPAELAPFITVERRPRALAPLVAQRNRLLDQIEAAGLEASVSVDDDAGRLYLSTENIQALSQAAAAGKIAIPDDAQVITNGAGPAGSYGEYQMEAAHRVLESAPDFAEMRALIEAVPQPFYGEAPRPVSKASSLDTARFLVALGFTAADIRALRAVGVDPVKAWIQQNGAATPENRAVLAEQVVVGEVVSVDPNAVALKDGARSTVRFRVVETLKGAARPGETVSVRLESGFDPDGKYQQANGEPMMLPGLPGALRPGDHYLLFLSHGQYANLARHVGRQPVPGLYGLRQEMARIDAGVVQRTYGEPSPGTLPQVRAQIAPVQAAFERAGIN
jgi:hypothetical protein